MRVIIIIIFLGTQLFSTGSAVVGTTLDFWHSYVHSQTHQIHYSFHLARYKRGLFWGSCGPSIRSLQWSFTFDLAGEGPRYSSDEIVLADDNGQPVHVVSGAVVTDAKRQTAKVTLEIENAGVTNRFVGNGEYQIRKLR